MTVWYVKRLPEQRIIDKGQAEIAKGQAEIAKAKSDGSSAVPKSPYRIENLEENGRLREVRYYRDNDLVASDRIDDSGKVVRRDFFVGSNVRAQLFFDSKGGIGLTRFFDERGRSTNTTPYLPVAPMRPGY